MTYGSLEILSFNFLLRLIALSIIIPSSYFIVRTQLSTSAKSSGLGLVVFNRWYESKTFEAGNLESLLTLMRALAESAPRVL